MGTPPSRPVRSRGFARRLAIVAVATLAAAPAAAVERPSPDGDFADLSLEQLMSIPVYSAAKREQSVSQAPSSVTVVTSQDIRAFGWRTLADLLRSVPGFNVIYPRTYGFVGVRGFGSPGDFGGRLLLLVNGHRLNDPLYDSAAVVEDFILDLDLVERVEIVRGPGSALYGNNAFFAVVNVFLRDAASVDGLEAVGEVGSYGARRGRLTWGHRTGDGAELLVSASGLVRDGKDPLRLSDFADGETGETYLRGGDEESASRLLLSHSRGGLTLEGCLVERHKYAPPTSGMPADVPRETSDARAFGEARYGRLLSPRADLTARLYYDWYSYWGNYPYDAAPAGEPRELVLNRDESTCESAGGELQVNLRPGTRHIGVVGLEYRHDFRQSMRNFDRAPEATYLDIDPDTRVFGFYLQDEFRPSTRLGLTAGLRYDHYESFGDALNPRLALVLDLDHATTLKCLYGEAFRAPNAYEFHYEDDGFSAKTNPGLEPEEIATLEVVAERRLGRDWRASVAGFRNDVTGLISELQDPADGLWYPVNLDRVEARGVELQVDGQVGERLLARGSFTYTRSRDKATDEALTTVPEYLGKLNLSTPLPGLPLFAGAELQYTGRRASYLGRELAPAWLANLNLHTRAWRGLGTVSLAVHNLFDNRYDDHAVGILNTIAQDGRTFRLALRLAR